MGLATDPGGRHGILETVLRPHLAVGNKKDFHLGVESAEEGGALSSGES